jgi:hypothetical protein
MTSILLFHLTACSSDSLDGSDSSGAEVVSSIHNPPVASLNDVLSLPETETTTFHPLVSKGGGHFKEYNSSTDFNNNAWFYLSDETWGEYQIDVDGGFSGISFAGTSLSLPDATVSDSTEYGLLRTFSDYYDPEITVLLPGSSASMLNYTSLAVSLETWSDYCVLDYDCTPHWHADVHTSTFGVMTSDEEVPQSGIVNFSGIMVGTYISENFSPHLLTGDVNLQVDFDNKVISGSLYNIIGDYYGSSMFSDLSLTGTFKDNRGGGNVASISIGNVPGMNGDFVIRFFGPNAEEIGGTFGLLDMNHDVAFYGAFASKQ